MRAALIQLCSGDDPAANLPITRGLISGAVERGADFITTPEVTNCVSADRQRQCDILTVERHDATLAALRDDAARFGIWLHVGSLALKADDRSRFVNRGFLIGPDGDIAARYDKIHMFDVQVSDVETYRESDAYRPGDTAVLAQTPLGRIGLTICYDLRFPRLYRDLAQAGVEVLLVPSAFSPATGPAHWEPLLRARAIETGCFVLAAAQCGIHPATKGRGRQTHGHSLAVSPWGRVMADGGSVPGITLVDLDLSDVADARSRIPSLTHDRAYSGP